MKKAFFLYFLIICFLTNCNQQEKKFAKFKNNLNPADKQNIQHLATSNNQFAFDFYQELQKSEERAEEKNKNIFFSPMSLYFCLGMMYFNPTQKEALSELEKVMYLEKYNKNAEKLGQYFYNFQGSILSHNGVFDLNIANALWINQNGNYKVDTKFQENIKKYFETNVYIEPFTNETAQKINNWASKETKGKISNIVNADAISAYNRLLLNAVYFKGDWDEPFDKENTTKEDFTLLNGKKIKVDMMKKTGTRTKFYGSPELKIIELPYKDHLFSAYFILPQSNNLFSKIENDLTFQNLNKWTNDMLFAYQELEKIFIPRFKFKDDIPCLDILRKMGLKKLSTDDIRQKTFVEVNEKGTEAAAVTVEEKKEDKPEPIITKDFVADRPFFFILKDKTTGGILFMGRILEPTSSDKQ